MQKTGKSQSKVSPFLKNLRDKTRKMDIDFNAPLLRRGREKKQSCVEYLLNNVLN